MKTEAHTSEAASLTANKLCHLTAIGLVFTLSSILAVSASTSNLQDAFSVVLEAEQLIVQAYEAVLDAERVGADVSGLLVRLNNASELLSEACMAFEAGDFEEAIRFSGLACGVGREVVDDAEKLEVEAGYAGANRFVWSLAGSVVGVALVVCASFWVYRGFKRRYYARLLKSRPRVD
ncbi:MAG: hypothetical protein JSV29_00740 [Candidatus Bathyarchaeota archaeon]|nr:MAG: hypothetical protein JSV29_00740 [Candidatus Bathyarchaeota archaeon]